MHQPWDTECLLSCAYILMVLFKAVGEERWSCVCWQALAWHSDWCVHFYCWHTRPDSPAKCIALNAKEKARHTHEIVCTLHSPVLVPPHATKYILLVLRVLFRPIRSHLPLRCCVQGEGKTSWLETFSNIKHDSSLTASKQTVLFSPGIHFRIHRCSVYWYSDLRASLAEMMAYSMAGKKGVPAKPRPLASAKCRFDLLCTRTW